MNYLEKIKQPENRKFELKVQLPQGKALLKTIAAFANGAGGELLIGVDDKTREIVGVNEPLLLEEQIINKIYDGIYPLVSPFCTIISIEHKTILSVRILSGSNKPYYIKSKGPEKGTFIRIGSTNRTASLEIVSELKRQVRGVSFVDEIDFQQTREDIEEGCLNEFMQATGLTESINDDVLAKFNIVQKNNGDHLPTIAGLVLCGKKGMPGYEYAGLRFSRFAGTTMQDLLDTRDYTVPLLKCIDSVCNDIVSFLPKESVFKGARRFEYPVVPAIAIREAVINAIVHRDYSIRGSSVKINLFDDRLEIISPGVLPGNLELNDLGTGLSESRNRTLVRVFRYLGLMEELGTGIARIYDVCKEQGIKTPTFQEVGQFFKVMFFFQKELVDLEKEIEQLLHRQGSMSAAQLSAAVKTHHNTVLKYLKKLIAAGKVVKKGAGKKTTYQTSR